MKMIGIDESEWKLAKIDSLVKEGVFSSRSEAYRSGALIMCIMDEAQKLAKIDRLDSDLFGREVRFCLKSLEQKKYQIVIEKLKEISDTIRLRGLLSPLIDTESDRDSFETLSFSVKKYANTIEQFDSYNETTQRRIIEDLKRDLSAIVYYLEQKESMIMEESKSIIVKSEPRKFNMIYKSKPQRRWIKKVSIKEYAETPYVAYVPKFQSIEA